MNVFQSLYQDDSWQTSLPEGHRASLVLVFGGKGLIEQSVCRSDIAMAFPDVEIIGCSTSGEILGPQVYDESLSVTAIDFDQVSIQACSDNIDHFADSESAGSSIAAQLNPET